MNHRLSSLIAASAIAVAPLAHGSDAALAKLQECMKLPLASPEHHNCVREVQQMRAAALMPTMPLAATAPAKPLPTTGAQPVPVDVKKAAQDLGLAGMAAKTAGVGGSGVSKQTVDISGLDLETALMAVQTQRANLLNQQLTSQMDAVRKRNDQVALLNKQVAELGALPNAKNDAAVQKKISDLKAQIDSLNSAQQMDMLKMQSLTNKRNEAFDIMTNFIKKMADSRSNVLGNMR